MTNDSIGMPIGISIKRLLYRLIGQPKTRQVLKWVVYSALIINTGFYFQDDYQSMVSALPDDASLLDVAYQFSNTIDMLAWLGLVFLFELETYAIEDQNWKNWTSNLVHSLRVICYALILHAAIGYTVEALENYDTHPVKGLNSLCDVTDEGMFAQISADQFSAITTENCEAISAGSPYYTLANEQAIVSASVVPHLQYMGLLDIVNAYVWIIVVLLIELEVFLQSKGRHRSRVLATSRRTKALLYVVLITNGVLWLLADYYLYAWDAFLWLFGFWAIELNLADWEKEKRDDLIPGTFQ